MTTDFKPHGALPVDDAREYLGGLSRAKFYELVQSRELLTFKIGRRRFASVKSLDDYIRRREEAA